MRSHPQRLGAEMIDRLDAASEETLLTLIGQDEDREKREQRRLLVKAHKESGDAVLEFIAAVGEENVQDRIGLLADRPPDDVLMEREVSLRLLRHIASLCSPPAIPRHDIVTVQVKFRRRAMEPLNRQKHLKHEERSSGPGPTQVTPESSCLRLTSTWCSPSITARINARVYPDHVVDMEVKRRSGPISIFLLL